MTALRWASLGMHAILAATLALVGAGVAHAAVAAGDLRETDVYFAPGAQRTDAERGRLEEAARELAGKGFPTKFVVTADATGDLDEQARLLRKDLGETTVSAVLILAPRRLGISAKVFECERALAFQAEVATLRDDDIQGTINVARRLQEYAAAGELRDSKCNIIEGPTRDAGFPWWIVGVIGAVVAAGVVAIVLIRRAVRRAEAGGSGAADAPDDDGGAEGQTPNP